jgi:uncharacterized protein
MGEHPNVARIRDGYVAFARGDFAILNELFAEDLLWHEVGRNQLSGDYRGRDAVYGLFGKLMEITEGTFHLDVKSIFADDERAVVLVVATGHRAGGDLEVYDAHIFHMRDGKVAEFWSASTDQHAVDEFIGVT